MELDSDIQENTHRLSEDIVSLLELADVPDADIDGYLAFLGGDHYAFREEGEIGGMALGGLYASLLKRALPSTDERAFTFKESVVIAFLLKQSSTDVPMSIPQAVKQYAERYEIADSDTADIMNTLFSGIRKFRTRAEALETSKAGRAHNKRKAKSE